MLALANLLRKEMNIIAALSLLVENKLYVCRLQQLIENTYKINNNARVALVTHSLGCIYATWFLNHQSQAWKVRRNIFAI